MLILGSPTSASTCPMRVIAGTFRSRPLNSLPGLDLRPTADRLRETLFNVLTSGNPAALEGSAWLDLFAGTGAVGIEALSRGAKNVCFVESSPRAAGLIRKNLQSLEVPADAFRIVQQDVLKMLRTLKAGNGDVDFAFLDPPYNSEKAYQQTLQLLAEMGIVKSGGMVIAEHQKRFDPGEAFGPLARYRKLRQGDAALSFYRLTR
jgi:16S rRNA (guanine966-N2)-methyltransferase